MIIGSGDPSWGFGALTKIGEVSRPLIVRGTGHGLYSGTRCIFKGFFSSQTAFSGSVGAVQPSAFGGPTVGEVKPALLLGLMPGSVLSLQTWDC